MQSQLTVTSVLAIALCSAPLVAQSPPQFKSAVELVSVDVQVVDKDGKPITGMTPADFEVTIDGRKRTVVSAQLVRYQAQGQPGPTTAPGTPQRRLYVIGVDEHSIRHGSARAATEAAKRFIAQLGPDDLVGLVAYPQAGIRVDPTNDHAQVIAALGKVRALFEPPQTKFNISASEAVDMISNNGASGPAVMERECAGITDPYSVTACKRQVAMEGNALGMALESTLTQSLGGLRGLLTDMGSLPGRKILILLSGGLLMSDAGVGRGDESGQMFQIGLIAARTNTTMYALHMDTRFLDAFAERRLSHTIFRDESIFNAGLERVAASAGGTVFRIRTGSGDPAFTRVLQETSAQYLLGVDVAPEDRGSQTAQMIKVKVKPKGATVRHRMSVVIPK